MNTNCFKKLIKLKNKLSRSALREPRKPKEILTRQLWERVKYILNRRYNHID